MFISDNRGVEEEEEEEESDERDTGLMTGKLTLMRITYLF